ncbi:MAG: repair protein RecO [Pseudomonadota bacterium]
MDRDRIIVLRTIAYRDSDLIIHGLNPQGAKVSYLAPGAKRSRRRFGGGVLEPTNYIEVVYQPNSKVSGSLRRLQEAQVLKDFPGLRRTYEVIQTSLSFLSLIDQVGQEGDIHGEELFNLLGHALQFLSQNEVKSLSLFRLHFLLKFLNQQGVLNLEDWMPPFLQAPLRDHQRLQKHFDSSSETWILDQLINVENLVQAYRTSGDGLTS